MFFPLALAITLTCSVFNADSKTMTLTTVYDGATQFTNTKTGTAGKWSFIANTATQITVKNPAGNPTEFSLTNGKLQVDINLVYYLGNQVSQELFCSK